MNFVRLEWGASFLAAVGSVWFVHEITRAYQRMIFVMPPTGGPTEIIGIAVLIWIYAKYQRYLLSMPAPEFMAKL